MANQNGENTLMSVAFFEVPNVYTRKIWRGIGVAGLIGLGLIPVIAGITGRHPTPEWCTEPPHVDTPDTPGRTPPIIIARPRQRYSRPNLLGSWSVQNPTLRYAPATFVSACDNQLNGKTTTETP